MSGLGDRKPSSLLCYMESLNADPKTLLQALFLAQLPMEVCRVLAGSPTSDLNDLAKEADAIMETDSLRSSDTGMSGVHSRHPLPPLSNTRNCAFTTTNLARRPGSPVGKNVMTVQDCRSGQAFIMDCGVEESVFPASAADKRHELYQRTWLPPTAR